MQETTDSFGKIVGPKVRELERKYANIKVTSSRSGKMSMRLMDQWIEDAYAPAVRAENGGAERVSRDDPNRVLIADSWGGQLGVNFTNRMQQLGTQLIRIPPHTTAQLQPLDVSFNRQYRRFVKLVGESALHKGAIANVTNRWGIINMHSLIWDQLSSPIYADMIRNGWRHTDFDFRSTELLTGQSRSVEQLQFTPARTHTCSVPGCTERAMLRCSHCGRPLCIHHFLERTCFHHHDHDHEHDHGEEELDFEEEGDDQIDFDDALFDEDLWHAGGTSTQPPAAAAAASYEMV